MERVRGKRALVTGAAQGLGAAAAQMLARHGAHVLLTDINEAGAQQVAESINLEIGSEVAWGFQHDATSAEDWAAAIEQARHRMNGLSVLVNNAGMVRTGSVEDLDLEQWHHVMQVNTDSVFLGCKLALPMMRECQPASIINLSSIAGLMASPNLAAYNASKAAVWLLTKSVALLAAKKGWDIRCNSIHPTFIRTPMLDDLRGDRDEAETLARLAKQVPLGRLGDPDDVAYAVLYMASDESRFITAAEFKIDGGISAI
ncbi:MAG TPA: SDR family oxidoreductase [Sphingopyxis sp.]|jgi:NAD(P)-dependent dehydrogenase (short-subunit alcohol dehydrogenase family)|uniref:SDR family oxidoreductase n=1 Tax=Sphingopyxis sp. TaxID=1908224 RepID=UPI001AC922C8|nr:glucose 1-dehydrogenase [Sphingomonadales bacterium]HEV7312434.1 SDR family oxidoreductase [Sphingopyxis sp.]HEV7341751.1 SDR family oxidoreductase [Sphingopyxis sp.]